MIYYNPAYYKFLPDLKACTKYYELLAVLSAPHGDFLKRTTTRTQKRITQSPKSLIQQYFTQQ